MLSVDSPWSMMARNVQPLVGPFVRLSKLFFDFQFAQIVSDDSDQLPISAH